MWCAYERREKVSLNKIHHIAAAHVLAFIAISKHQSKGSEVY
jgi:hypothetical protein